MPTAEEQVERALRAIYQHGVIHRDVRGPTIPFCEETDGAMMMDFEMHNLLPLPMNRWFREGTLVSCMYPLVVARRWETLVGPWRCGYHGSSGSQDPDGPAAWKEDGVVGGGAELLVNGRARIYGIPERSAAAL